MLHTVAILSSEFKRDFSELNLNVWLHRHHSRKYEEISFIRVVRPALTILNPDKYVNKRSLCCNLQLTPKQRAWQSRKECCRSGCIMEDLLILAVCQPKSSSLFNLISNISIYFNPSWFHSIGTYKLYYETKIIICSVD